VYLSNSAPILTGLNSVSVGAGVRVDCYVNMTTNVGAQRLVVANTNGGIVSWGVQELVLASCRPALIGGVLYDLPSSISTQNNKANMAGAAADTAAVFLLFFVAVALFWQLFRRR